MSLATMSCQQLLCIVAVVCLFGATVNSQPAADKISSLPGLDFDVNYEQYSGYLSLPSNGHHLHYWLTLAQNLSYPNDAPLVLWLNGGPGCSSLDGLLYEQGPIHVDENGALYNNEFAWNTVANMLFLEAPICVGYSYADDGNCTMDDDSTATDNYHALLQFLDKFSQFESNEFFVTGESYGGVYVPTLTRRILDGNKNGEGTAINLKGFAVGNGASSESLNTDSSMWYAYHHGLIGEQQWNALMEHCCTAPYTRHTCPFSASNDKNCTAEVADVMAVIYSGNLNWYNLYGDCESTRQKYSYQKYMHELSWTHRWFHERNNYKYIRQLQQRYQENVPCIDTTGADIYLNREDVRNALHISSKVAANWSICSSTLNYTGLYPDLSPVYQDIFKLEPSIRAMVYNGDTDLSCNFLLDEWFVDDLDFAAKNTWREWFYDDTDGQQVAGFTKDFDGISFVTVRGSGHMVPQFRPAPALKMITNFLQNKQL